MLLGLSGCWLAKPWKIDKDGYATLDPGATAEERRNHPSDRYNIVVRHAFRGGKSYANVIGRFRHSSAIAGNPFNSGSRQRRRRRWTLPPPAPPVALSKIDLTPEQVVLREDGNPNDTLGLLVALRASEAVAEEATTKEGAETVAAIEAAATIEATAAASASAGRHRRPARMMITTTSSSRTTSGAAPTTTTTGQRTVRR